MRQKAPVQVVVHRPATEAGRQALAGRAAQVHADCVEAAVRRLDCPARQKLELLGAVMDTVRGTCKPG